MMELLPWIGLLKSSDESCIFLLPNEFKICIYAFVFMCRCAWNSFHESYLNIAFLRCFPLFVFASHVRHCTCIRFLLCILTLQCSLCIMEISFVRVVLIISSWNLHDMWHCLWCTRVRKFGWIRQKSATISHWPYCKNRLFWQ